MDENDLKRLEAAIFRGLLDKHEALQKELQEFKLQVERDKTHLVTELSKRDLKIQKLTTQLAPILVAISMVGGAVLAWLARTIGS